MRFLTVLMLYFSLSISVLAQQLAVPIVKDCKDDQAACYATSQVDGLQDGEDGFLAVREGPGSEFGMIGKLRNGDIVTVIEFHGDWRGVELQDGSMGWVHSNWLSALAG